MLGTVGKREAATRTCLILLGVLFVLNVLDTAVTLIVIRPDMLEAEINFVPRMLLRDGPETFAIVKTGAVTAVLAYAWWRLRKGSNNLHIIKPVLSVVAVLMVIVIAIGASALVV